MNYPLFLTFRGMLLGNGFIAEVSMRGRLLATIEPDGVWLYGVQPGAIAEGGATLEKAHGHFSERLKAVLADMAASALSLDMFRSKVESFFHQTDELTVAEWNAAVEKVRSAQLSLGDLPRQPADSEISVSVTEVPVSQLKSADNFVSSSTALAADKAA